MEDMEEKAIKLAKCKPTVLYKYVNDTLVLLKEDKNKSNKLTREMWNDGTLPFLGVTIIKKDDCLSQFREGIPIQMQFKNINQVSILQFQCKGVKTLID